MLTRRNLFLEPSDDVGTTVNVQIVLKRKHKNMGKVIGATNAKPAALYNTLLMMSVQGII